MLCFQTQLPPLNPSVFCSVTNFIAYNWPVIQAISWRSLPLTFIRFESIKQPGTWFDDLMIWFLCINLFCHISQKTLQRYDLLNSNHFAKYIFDKITHRSCTKISKINRSAMPPTVFVGFNMSVEYALHQSPLAIAVIMRLTCVITNRLLRPLAGCREWKLLDRKFGRSCLA